MYRGGVILLLVLCLFPSGLRAELPIERPTAWWQSSYQDAGKQTSFQLDDGNPASNLSAKQPPEAFLRSLVLPGWGQRYAERYPQAALFTSFEVGLWAGFFVSYTSWQRGEENYIVYARQHAGVSGSPNHEYYVNIGNYPNRDAYNEAKRLQRAYDEQYYGASTWWEWDDSRNQREFKNLRITSDRHRNRMYYLVGGMVLNRILSAIDAGRGLSGRQKKESVQGGFQLGYDPRIGGPSLSWSGNLGR